MTSAARTIALADYLPRSLYGRTRSARPPRWPDKPYLAILDYSLDVTNDATDTDSVASFVVRFGGTVRPINALAVGSVITVWLSGGQISAFETIGLTWRTTEGRLDAASVNIAVSDQGDYSGDALLDAGGKPLWDNLGNVILGDPGTLSWTAA